MKAVRTVVSDGVAVVEFTNPPVNSLHPTVVTAVINDVSKAQSDPGVKAIVVTGGNNYFSAGFDVNEFTKPGGGQDFGQSIMEGFHKTLEAGPKPVVAALADTCLGGGCELAVACNGRVCTKGTKIGLPELQLGIIPGFGGTQRLPRLVGLKRSVEMMLTSAPMKADEALRTGLVDTVVQSSDDLLPAAKKLALEMANGQRPKPVTIYRNDKLETYPMAKLILSTARREAVKKSRHLRHPGYCLDAIEYGVENGGEAGLLKEAEYFVLCRGLDTHRALLHTFLSQRQTKRVKGVTDVGLTPRQLRHVAVIGGGLMGSGIITALLSAGYKVTLKEINAKAAEAGVGRVKSNLSAAVKKGRMTPAGLAQLMSRLTAVTDYAGFEAADMVIEAATENIPLKQRIFEELERLCKKDCILATNTSTIDITLVGGKTRALDRVVGAHFFSPAHVMPLLEIVRSQYTSSQVLLDTLALSGRIKKTPVVVGNCTGFAVNRVFFPYTMAAVLLVDHGLSPYAVDKAVADFGMPMGPFRLQDLVGADVGLHVAGNFVESYPDRVYRSHITPLLNEANRLGEKTGKGTYRFDRNKRGEPDMEVMGLIQESRRRAGLDPNANVKMSDEEVVETIFFPVVNEGCRILAEGIVDKPSDLDVSCVLGMGFPAWRGGIIFYGDLCGAAYIEKRLDALAAKYPNHASFFRPCDYLRACVKSGAKLSEGPQEVVRSRL